MHKDRPFATRAYYLTWSSFVGRRVGLALFVLAAGFAVTPRAAFAGWPLESGGSVLLGFGGSYIATSGPNSTHRGVDISGPSGTRIVAPLAGTVTFAGRVPAANGSTCGAVTISTAQGSLTMLPLASIAVARGSELREGDPVGALAADGDVSSRASHVHVGLRRGDLYVDPMGVLATPVPSQDPPAQTEPVTGPAAQAAAATARAGSRAARAMAVPGTPADASVPAGSVAPATGNEAAAVHAPLVGEQLASGVSIAGGPVTSPAAAPASSGIEAVPGELGTMVRAETRASASADTAARASSLAAQLARWSVHAAQVLGMGAVGVLLALGLLWPLWRRDECEGLGELAVRDIRDDVAAAVGR